MTGITNTQGIVAIDLQTGSTFINGTINNSPIGATTPSTGNFTTVSAVSIHANAIVSAGTDVNAAGNVIAGARTVICSGDAGNVTAATFSSVTSGAIVLTTVASGQGAQAATLLNSPIAGNPSFYVPIRINGTIGFFPVWK